MNARRRQIPLSIRSEAQGAEAADAAGLAIDPLGMPDMLELALDALPSPIDVELPIEPDEEADESVDGGLLIEPDVVPIVLLGELPFVGLPAGSVVLVLLQALRQSAAAETKMASEVEDLKFMGGLRFNSY